MYFCYICRQDYSDGVGDVDFCFVGFVLVQVLDGYGYDVVVYLGVVVVFFDVLFLVDCFIDDGRDVGW